MNSHVLILIAAIFTGFLWVINKLVLAKKASHSSVEVWVKKIGDYFFVFLGVFIFRAFLFEFFLIPSSSMVPTFVTSDYVIANKFAYSVNIPITDEEIISIAEPKRGEIIVFRNPLTPELTYVKRIIGVPGDRISYIDKRLSINGKALDTTPTGQYKNENREYSSDSFIETLDGLKHTILTDKDAAPSIENPSEFPNKNMCSYLPNGIECTVPSGNFFMMGDNRDNSLDSRSWGFVPKRNIVGKVNYILVNPRDFSRSGNSVYQ